MKLENQVAIVTGGSRGIGRAICLELARQGWDICVNYHERADAAAETAQAVRALGRRARQGAGRIRSMRL